MLSHFPTHTIYCSIPFLGVDEHAHRLLLVPVVMGFQPVTKGVTEVYLNKEARTLLIGEFIRYVIEK